MRRLSYLASLLIMLFPLIGFINITNGATHYVNQDGSASFKHVQAAINNAAQGDTIIVEPGKYWEDLLIRNKTDLTIEALEESSKHSSILNGVKDQMGLGMIKIINSKNITLKGFKISGNPNAPDRSLYVSSSTVTLMNNTFDRQQKTAVYAEKGANVEIIRNNFRGNGTAVEVTGSRIKLYSNLLLYHKTAGIQIKNGGKVIAEHNTFYNNKGTVFTVHKKAALALYSNIFAGNGAVLKAPRSTLSDYNLYYQNGRNFNGGVRRGANDLFGDPKFQDPANDDFRLSADSPANGKSKEGLDIGAVIAN